MKLFPVVMAGGSGTRFWPLSRERRPKQFLSLATSKTLIAETVERLKLLAPKRDILVVCGKRHAAAVQKLTALPKRNIVVEPMARNTAPAVALGLVEAMRRHRDALVAALPADHHVANVAAFTESLRRAAELAGQGYIVTLGLKPTRPDTGFGYILAGDPIGPGVRKAVRFVEKPDAVTAAQYIASGNYVWNGGIFVFRAEVMKEAFAKHAPVISEAVEKLIHAPASRYAASVKRLFARLPSISIDYAIAEKVDNIAVVSGDFGWSDVGSFAALREIRALDEKGNVQIGEAIIIDSTNCVVLGGKRPLAVVGMKNAVVVDAGDAVLVTTGDRAQDVRKVVEYLRSHRLGRYL